VVCYKKKCSEAKVLNGINSYKKKCSDAQSQVINGRCSCLGDDPVLMEDALMIGCHCY
jgi:hypothetical protein